MRLKNALSLVETPKRMFAKKLSKTAAPKKKTRAILQAEKWSSTIGQFEDFIWNEYYMGPAPSPHAEAALEKAQKAVSDARLALDLLAIALSEDIGIQGDW